MLVARTAGGPAGGCWRGVLETDTSESSAAAADDLKVGSCLLQAQSPGTSRRSALLDENVESPRSARVDTDSMPTAEDTIPDSYWKDAQRILDSAAFSTPTPRPIVVDEPAGGATLQNALRDKPWIQGWSDIWYDATQPISTRIGAALLYDASVDEFTMPTQEPRPTKQYIRSSIHGNCPLAFWQHKMDIYPPRCGETQGSWHDPKDERVAMRWEKVGHGMHFGVDSVVSGNGSVTYASIEPQLVLEGYKFSISNCQGTARYSIDEAIIKVDHMGANDESTRPHDPFDDHQTFLLRYTVLHEDGSIVMQTNLFRTGSDSMNFSTVEPGPDGPMSGEPKHVAYAARKGNWTKSGWRSCKRNARGWHLEFPQQLTELNESGTLLDLRVLATAVVTFMAAREEDRDASTGLASEGEAEVFLNFVWSSVVVLVGALIACCCCCLCAKFGKKDKWRKIFFSLEGAVMPKRPHMTRAPVLRPVY